jgi:hypothetical protein
VRSFATVGRRRGMGKLAFERVHLAPGAGALDAAVAGVAERVDAEGDQPRGDDPEQERAV